MRARGLAVGVWLVAGAHLLLLLVLAGRYGYHRDELYFLEAAQHLALGYVDQPPLVPALARAQVAALGDTVTALRVVPALVSTASVLLAALLAREFGGGRRAQTVAAAAIAGAGFVLATGHLLSTATIDFAMWSAAILVVARLLRRGDPRWWVAFGAVAGVALWNKHLIALLAVAVVGALLIERRTEVLSLRWLAAGAGVAVVLAAPVLWWQATNGWPQVEMAGALSERLGTENRVTLLPLQALLLGPLVVPLALSGGRWLWRGGAPFRPLLWAYGLALVLTFVTGGRPYYPLPLLAALVVAGAVALEPRPARWVGPALAVHAAVSAVIGLPLLPVDVLAETPIGEINDTQVETIGWQALVADVAAAVETLPAPAEDVVILTGSYGEAGALDRFGGAAGLPEPYSGHNSYWFWRRPVDDDAPVVAVRYHEDTVRRHFTECRLGGRVDNDVGVDNEAQGAPIWVCDGPRRPWTETWPELRSVS